MLIKRIKADFAAAYRSIKLPEVEEWFDIYFSRFLGYYFAILSAKIRLTPHQVSILSLLAGFVAGYLFYFQDSLTHVIWACFFITLSGILDSADGQLARMTNQASDLGRKIDAIIDTFVFVACYIGGTLYFLPIYGWYIIPIAALAGWLHSAKSAAYEFYKTEFILYLKKANDHRIPFLEEVKNTKLRGGFWNECLYYLEVDYIRKQAFFISRSDEHRKIFYEWAFGPDQEVFTKLYLKYNHNILTPWALICGTNVHRTALMIFSIYGRMDLYFFFAIVTYLPMIWVNKKQKFNDNQLVLEMEESIKKSAIS